MPVVLLDDPEEEAGLARRPATGPEPARRPLPESPAYAIYTSGSTGRPKGVVIPHANVVRLFTRTRPWFGFGPDDVWTLFHSPYAFDFSVWELWGPLLHGGGSSSCPTRPPAPRRTSCGCWPAKGSPSSTRRPPRSTRSCAPTPNTPTTAPVSPCAR